MTKGILNLEHTKNPTDRTFSGPESVNEKDVPSIRNSKVDYKSTIAERKKNYRDYLEQNDSNSSIDDCDCLAVDSDAVRTNSIRNSPIRQKPSGKNQGMFSSMLTPHSKKLTFDPPFAHSISLKPCS